MDSNDDENSQMAKEASGFLRDEIISGRLKPGDIIPVSEISSVSRYPPTTIYQGLSRLLGGRLVTDVEGSFRVADQSKVDLEDLMHTQFLLEGVALRDSIICGDDDWEDATSASLEDLMGLDPGAWKTLEAAVIHTRFHQTLISASRLDRVRDYLDTIYDQCSWYLIAGKSRSCSDYSGHRVLAEAALARDPEAATEQLRMLLFPVSHRG